MAAGWKFSGFLAVVYILLYLAFVVLVPVLVLATLILTAGQRLLRKKDASLR